MMAHFLKRVFAFRRPKSRPLPFAVLFKKFQHILDRNNRILELMADMGDKLGGEYVFDRRYIEQAVEQLEDHVFKLISDLSVLTQRKNVELFMAFERIRHLLWHELSGQIALGGDRYVLGLDEIGYDQIDQAGGKMAHVGDLRNRLGLLAPDGFVITTRAFHDFMTQSGLLARAREGIAAWDGEDEAALDELAADMRRRIMTAPLPRGLARQVEGRVDRLLRGRNANDACLAVRSSAWHEDGDASFAGQYSTVLDVPGGGVMEAYRQVLASAYSPSAWRYRLLRGYREHEVGMAVGCQLMAHGTISGVLHTYASQADEGVMVVDAVCGPCQPVVDGTAASQVVFMDRVPPYRVRGDVSNPLDADQVRELAETALRIERYYRRPQDIEWTFDEGGDLHILQTRPLRGRSAADAILLDREVDAAARGAEVIFAGRGLVAQRGVASGTVRVVRGDADLEDFPAGGILVARHTSPRYSRVMSRARGIITDIGSPTGHMATITREFRVPALVNTGVGTELLHDGDEITLDSGRCTVYRGRIPALDRFELIEEDVFEDSYEYRLLRRLLKHISPLNLMDPHGENFLPSACRTYHDITRFIHESAVDELIRLSQRHGADGLSSPRRLQTAAPLDLMLVDAGEGIDCPEEAETVTREQITSLPLKEFLTGIDICGMWCTEPVSVDLSSFMASVTRRSRCCGTQPGGGPRELHEREPASGIPFQHRRRLSWRHDQQQLYLFPFSGRRVGLHPAFPPGEVRGRGSGTL
jgi:pyruvate,water dikinase